MREHSSYKGEVEELLARADLLAGQWHVGFKRAFDLFPKGLRKRIVTERKKRIDQQQRIAVTKATADHAKLSAELNKQASSPPFMKTLSMGSVNICTFLEAADIQPPTEGHHLVFDELPVAHRVRSPEMKRRIWMRQRSE